jgi:hypothetical protein
VSTLEFGQFEHCVVFVCGAGQLDEGEWSAYLTYLSRNLSRVGPNRSLVVAVGGTLNSRQRKSLAETIEPFQDLKSAVITQSILVRGIITALQLFRRDVFRVFAPGDINHALEFLDLNAAQARQVEMLAAGLQKKLADSGSSRVA